MSFVNFLTVSIIASISGIIENYELELALFEHSLFSLFLTYALFLSAMRCGPLVLSFVLLLLFIFFFKLITVVYLCTIVIC
jgi:hypothetical protein